MSGRGGNRGGVNSQNASFYFIEQGSKKGSSSTQRKVVRTKAALAGANTRKQTIATRGAKRTGEKEDSSTSSGAQSPEEGEPDAALIHTGAHHQPLIDARVSQDDVVQQLAQHLSELQLAQSLQPSSLPHKAVRNALWNGMVNSTVLFQASLFVSSTWRNTAGLPPSMQWNSFSQILLKMGTIQVVNTNITSQTGESLTPFAIAMLASWERQHGNKAEHDLHMQGWRSLPMMPSSSLDEKNIANLSDLTLEAFREALTDRSLSTPIGSRTHTYHVLLPLGFWHFRLTRPETRSLLDLVSHLIQHDPSSPSAVMNIRRLGLEISAWTPYHTHGVSPHPSIEASYPPEELNALYHIRAVSLQIAGMLLRVSVTAHGILWPWDEKEALALHTRICADLRTEILVGTRFQEVAVWSRFLMCACSEDPQRDGFIRGLLVRLNLRTWASVREMLGRHVYIEVLHGWRCRDFFERIMVRRGVGSP